MKQLTTSQASKLFLSYTCLSKIMLLPSIITGQVGNSFWIVLLLVFAIEFLLITLLLHINSKNPDLTLFECMQAKFGKIFVKIFCFLIGIVFLTKLTIMLHEIYIYLFEILYVDLSWVTILVPLFIFLGYVGTRNLRNAARCMEIYGALIFFTIFLALLDSLTSLNVLNMLPFFTKNLGEIFNSSLNNILWFGDFLLLFFMLGNIKMEKNTYKKLIFGWLSAVLITFVVFFNFYCLFGAVSPYKRIAIVNLTQYSPRLGVSTGFVWLVAMIWTLGVVFEIILLCNLITNSFLLTFNIKKKYVSFVLFTCLAIILLILFITNFRITYLIQFIQQYFKYFILAVQYILVLIAIMFMLSPSIRRRKNYGK